MQRNLLDLLDISVSEAEKRANGALNIREYFTVYLIETVVKDNSWKKLYTKLGTIWRRYSEFEQLHSYLETSYPYIIIPPLPEKKILFKWEKSGIDTFDPDFVERRRAGLENFLFRVAAHPVLCFNKLFLAFLQQEENWQELWKDTGYLQQAENKLKSIISYPLRIKKPDERFEAMKDYCNEINNHLYNLLKTRSKLAERFYARNKLHANYGRVFSEWSVSEKTFGNGLQKAGHFLDSLAASTERFLEDEEIVSNQLKEYFFFGGALQGVCKRRDLLQLELQKAEEMVFGKICEKDQVQKGKTSLMSRLFGSISAKDTKEAKLGTAERKIQEGRNNLQAIQSEMNNFCKEALSDYERFEKQKTLDVKQILANYTAVQIKVFKQGLQTWNNVKDCLENSSWSLEPTLQNNIKLPCSASVSKLQVEKIEGGLVVAGVVIAANCQVALPVFGFLFILIGIVLTVASYRGPSQDEEPENYAARLAFTGNSRILGPSCIAVGIIMLSAGIILCVLSKRARQIEKLDGFHCPIHGDFYPLSSVGEKNSNWSLSFKRGRNLQDKENHYSLPHCPHTQLSSTRSSLSSESITPCSTHMPFIVTSNSISDLGISIEPNLSPDLSLGSVKFFSASKEVASFPHSRTPSPPHLFQKR